MEKYLWQKTLLELYHTFDSSAILMDQKFEKLLKKSFGNNNCQYFFDEVFYLMKSKNNCLLAKEIVDFALNAMCKEKKFILNYYFKKKYSFKKIANIEQINIRQVFRNFDKELAMFAFYLSKQGFDTDRIESEFKSDFKFFDTYKKLLHKSSKNIYYSVKLPMQYVDKK